MTITSARWDLTNVYPSLESKEFQDAIKDYKGLLNKLEKFYKGKISKASAKTSSKELGTLLGRSVDQFNAIAELSGTIEAYIYSFVSTDSHNKAAMRLLSCMAPIMASRVLRSMRAASMAECSASLRPRFLYKIFVSPLTPLRHAAKVSLTPSQA